MAAPNARFTLDIASLTHGDLAREVRDGLSQGQKALPPKLFYDDLGSALFEAICFLPEYYVSRCETEIFESFGLEIIEAFGRPVRLIELGSGTSRKTRFFLDRLTQRQNQLEYVPIDIDNHLLERTGENLIETYPTLTVHAIAADFRDVQKQLQRLIKSDSRERNIVLFLGSTIGNLEPEEQVSMLASIRRSLNHGDMLLLGADLRKDKVTLDAAYDDQLGVTAAFDLNLLVRINRDLGGHFDLARFRHRAFFDETKSRIEMHIVSDAEQRVRIDAIGLEVAFDAGETIHTENSYKFDEDSMETLARRSGFAVTQRWTDSRRFFADTLLTSVD